jgi:hypothetical protein
LNVAYAGSVTNWIACLKSPALRILLR